MFRVEGYWFKGLGLLVKGKGFMLKDLWDLEDGV